MQPASPCRPALPIDPFLPAILAALERCPGLVLRAEPGAGKTTRVPAALLEAPFLRGRQIAVLEPRRIAARLAARRVAAELGEPLGARVGLQVRFEEISGPGTRLRFMTEGVLIRRLLKDPELRDFGAVVFDEVHERHLDTDLGLALIRRLQARRPELKVVAMSATLDADGLSAFLGQAPIVDVPGRRFEVDIEHLRLPDARPLDEQVASAVRRALQEGTARGEDAGDVLVFLPGAAEIRRAAERCAPLAERFGLSLRILHGDLPADAQDRAVAPGPERKLFLATNLAESSITLEGVRCVIDSGLARVPTCSAWSGLPSLQVERISKSSALQRAGRAGRVRSGRCLRLYDRHDFDTRPEHTTPEIARLDLAEATLSLHGLGVRDPAALGWLEPPPPQALEAAESLLTRLGALDGEGQPTALGKRMLDFPAHPRLARVLLEASRSGLRREGCLLAAILGERAVVKAARTAFGSGPISGKTAASDALDALERIEAAARSNFSEEALSALDLDAGAVRAVSRVQRKLLQIADKERSSPPPKTPEDRERALLRALLCGFPDRVARRRVSGPGTPSPEVLLCGGGTARLSPSSVVREGEFLVALEAEERGRGARRDLQIRQASEIEPEWLLDLFAEQLSEEVSVSWNESAERVEARSRLVYEKLAIEEGPVARAAPEIEAEVLARAAREKGVGHFVDPAALDALKARVECLKDCFPELGVEPITDANVERALVALCEGRRSFRELREADLLGALLGDLPPGVAPKLDALAPASIALPGGRRVRVHYEPGLPPWIESRLQDFFGMREVPRLAQGRLPLVVHLLAPNQRAVQVTTDLTGFWTRHYPDLRKALSRRYPRHDWPDDPLAAHPPSSGRR